MPPLKEPKQRRRRRVMRTQYHHDGIISKLLNGNPPPVAVLILVLGLSLWVVGTVILRGIESSSSSTSIGHLRGGNGMVWVHSDSQPFVSRVSLLCTELCLLLSFSIYFVLFNMCSCYNISYKNDTTHMFPE